MNYTIPVSVIVGIHVPELDILLGKQTTYGSVHVNHGKKAMTISARAQLPTNNRRKPLDPSVRERHNFYWSVQNPLGWLRVIS